jgi:predicted metal-dependent hydrolase
MATHQLALADGILDYVLRFSERRTLAISVLPDGGVDVSAPLEASIAKIEERLVARLSWIRRQQVFFGQFAPRVPARRHVGGETHLYLGRQYRLRVEQGEKELVALRSGRLFVSLPGVPTPEKTSHALATWYHTRALVKLPERFANVQKQVAYPGLIPARLSIRPLQRRWGSMSPAGRLTLNAMLIKAPVSSIDYVIVHELCHLAHADHSPAFYRLLRRLMPDWESRKARLERLLS